MAWLEVGKSSFDGQQRIRAILAKASSSVQHGDASVDFVLYGSLVDIGQRSASPFLLLEWQDGHQERLQLPPPCPAPTGRSIARIMALPWKHYFSRGWRLICQRQSGLLLRKLAGMTSALLTSGWRPERLLAWAALGGKPLALVIDHDLGGGANLYRHGLMSRLSKEGFVPLLLSAHHGVLAYQLTARCGARQRSAHVEDLQALFGYLSQVDIERVIFNNILSFPEPLVFVRELVGWLLRKKPAQFLFLVHDYYSICPVWLLLDNVGKYCGIPDTSVCAQCLRWNPAPFLEFSAGADIVSWRTGWAGLLQQADEIRCFSRSSRDMLLRAHPDLEPARISMIPHTLDHVHLRKPNVQDAGYPVIGVIGHIASHKGAQVVRDLASYVAASGGGARIIVIGTIEFDLPAATCTITGPYRPAELPALLERYQVSIGFLPSICPETFSYVAEEMMMMGLPVLAFDLGAPGERVAAYERGMVIPVGGPDSILAAIEFLYSTHISVKPK